MARARKATHEAVLEAAGTLFFQDGYTGVSTREIEEKTGLTRFTLQTSYGGKKALFLNTLDCYLEHLVHGFLPSADSDVLEGLAAWFEEWTTLENSPGPNDQGCLIINTMTEFERGDAATDARIEKYFTELRNCLGGILTKGIALGEVDPKLDVAAKTELLVATILGMNMMVRANSHPSAARATGISIGAMIREWHS
jgi:TetR/AcrR family transcriptional repressor of nem operon